MQDQTPTHNTHADWIDGENDDREMAKIEHAIRTFSPELAPDSDLVNAKKLVK